MNIEFQSQVNKTQQELAWGTQIIQDEDWLTNANSLTNIHDPHKLLSKISRAPCRAVVQSAQNMIAAAGLN